MKLVVQGSCSREVNLGFCPGRGPGFRNIIPRILYVGVKGGGGEGGGVPFHLLSLRLPLYLVGRMSTHPDIHLYGVHDLRRVRLESGTLKMINTRLDNRNNE